MRNKCAWMVVVVLVGFLLMANGVSAEMSSDDSFKSDLQKATAQLYIDTWEGDMERGCSMVAFKRGENNTYFFITSAYCVGDDWALREFGSVLKELSFYLTLNEPGPITYYPARLVGFHLSSQLEGGGILIFKSVLYRDIPIFPLATRQLKNGEKIVNFAPIGNSSNPMLNGWVTRAKVKKPLEVNGKKNSDMAVLCLGKKNIKPTSEDPVIVSRDQRAIVAIFMGTAKYRGVEKPVAIPIYKLIMSLVSSDKK